MMNVFLPGSLFDNDVHKWVIKVKVDDNRISGKDKKAMKDFVKKFKTAIDTTEKYKDNKVAIILEKSHVDAEHLDKGKWQVFLQNSFNTD